MLFWFWLGRRRRRAHPVAALLLWALFMAALVATWPWVGWVLLASTAIVLGWRRITRPGPRRSRMPRP